MRTLCPTILTIWLLCVQPAAAQQLDERVKAIEANPNDEKGYEEYALAAIGLARFDDAIAVLQIGIAHLPAFPRGCYLMAVAYRGKHAWAEAAGYYRVFLALRPDGAD